MSFSHRQTAMCTCLLLCSLITSHAEQVAQTSHTDNDLCPPRPVVVTPEHAIDKTDDQRTHISADEARVDSENLTSFRGDVRVTQGKQQLHADSLKYDRNTERFEASGNITYATGDLLIKGDSADLNLGTSQGVIENPHYYAGTVNGRGNSRQIIIESDKKLRLTDTTYTTCPPDAEAWRINADQITLDNNTRQGTARSMTLEIARIPVLYLPYMRFPIGEERMSGLLYPSFGVSDEHGTELSIPYYWNIAPQMDATITPHNMTKRGLMLETEFRYMTEANSGTVFVNYLYDDKLYGDDRENFSWQNSGSSNAGWSTHVDYNYLSDIQYVDDFSGSLATSSVTHYNRSAQADYNSENFVFSTQLQDYQNISGTEAYKRLPQLTFNTRFSKGDKRFSYDLVSELVRFDHKNDANITGQRLKLNPFISYTVQGNAGYFSPRLSLHHIQYDLDNLGATTQTRDPNVSVPVFSLDTGLFLERDTTIAGVPLLHTLEPRLFYLRAPYHDQSDLPIFDTGQTGFSESLLFAENRFSGNDRIGDANQLTASVATRLYRQDNGNELFSATLGQIFYFDDRMVTLPGTPVETQPRSNYIGAVNFNPHRAWRMSSHIQWDPESRHTEIANSRIQHIPATGRVINLDYRFTREALRTRGVSFAWRLNPRWQFYGGNIYDIENERSQEDFLGFRYDDCCWGIRLVGKRLFDTLVNNEPRYENAVFLELELKGLSSLGYRKDIDQLLENGILGYTQ